MQCFAQREWATDNWMNDCNWKLVDTFILQHLTITEEAWVPWGIMYLDGSWGLSLPHPLQTESTWLTISTEGSAHVVILVSEWPKSLKVTYQDIFYLKRNDEQLAEPIKYFLLWCCKDTERKKEIWDRNNRDHEKSHGSQNDEEAEERK